VTAIASSRRPPRTKAEQFIARLKLDYPFWAEQCYRIRDKHGHIRPLTLNRVQHAIRRAQLEMLAERGMARLFVLKARQGGVSTDQQAQNLHQCWSEPNFDALTLAHTTEDTDKLFEITRRAIDHFPDPLLPSLGGKETKEISFPGIDTHFFTGTAGAKRTGRGMTLKRFHGSEFAMWDSPMTVLGTVRPALVPHGSVVVLETTASGFGTPAHQFWTEAEKRGYRPLFFPWWDCDWENYRLALAAPDELGALEPEEQDLVDHKGLDLEQIKWRRVTMAELERDLFLQEFAEDPETCWLAVGGMFYDVTILKALQVKAPKPREILLGGTLELYREKPEGERVIIGCDTAEGGGGDRSTWTARAFPSWKLLARFADSRIEPDPLGDLLDEWGRKLGGSAGPAFLVIEKNGHGITVIRRARDVKKYPPAHIYHRAPLDTDKGQQEKKERIGWATTAESKPLMLDAGRELFKAARDRVRRRAEPGRAARCLRCAARRERPDRSERERRAGVRDAGLARPSAAAAAVDDPMTVCVGDFYPIAEHWHIEDRSEDGRIDGWYVIRPGGGECGPFTEDEANARSL
jgi:hypothetical protein